MSDFLEPHLAAFLKAPPPQKKWRGKNLRQWADKVDPSLSRRYGLASIEHGRSDLRGYCQQATTSDEACFLAIMAWGGMRLDHAREAWARRSEWLGNLRAIRHDNLTRRECYDLFAQDRRAGRLPGIGPAYFTKLIFFARSAEDGYIMDQWTGKSVNLLTGSTLVDLSHAGHVTDVNSAQEYDHFCATIEALGALCNLPPDRTEERLFSIGGRNPGDWRAHVCRHWKRQRRV